METLEQIPYHVMEKSFHKKYLKSRHADEAIMHNACLHLSGVKVSHKKTHMCRADELTEM